MAIISGPSAAGSLTRKTVAFDFTPVGNDDALLTLSMSKVYHIISVTSDQPIWLRLYQSAADRTNDSGRDIATDPANDAGVVAEYALAGAGTILANPIPTGSQATGDVPIAIRNTDTSPVFTSLTIEYLEVET